MKEMLDELVDLRAKVAECEKIVDLAAKRVKSDNSAKESELAKVAHHYAKAAAHFKRRADKLENDIARRTSEQ